MTDLVAISDEYVIPYHVLSRHAALKESRRLRNNNRHYLSARPLLELMRRAGMTQRDFARRCRINDWTVYRWTSTGVVEIHTADRVAVALGEHPASLWGNDWHAVCALMEDVHMHRKAAA